ncbi:MAG: tetratricopeptide repeat protein [Byssovorax sp.]
MIAAVVPAVALGTSTAQAQPKGAKAPTGVPSEDAAKKATAFYVKGSDLFKAKKFALALEQFRLSYAAVASPNSHLYIARCLAASGDSRAAYAEFDKVVEEAAERGKTEDKYLPTRDTARVERDELLSKVALVTISVVHPGPTTLVRIGDTEVPREQWDKPIAVAPGPVEAKISAGDRAITSQSATVNAGQSRTLVLDAAAAPVAAVTGPGSTTPTTKSSRSALFPAGIAVGAVGVVGFVLFAIEGSASKSTYDDLTKACGAGPCPASLADKISSGKSQQTIANVGLVLGVVGVAAGTTMIVLSTRKPKDAPAPSTSLVVGPGYLGAKGTF